VTEDADWPAWRRAYSSTDGQSKDYQVPESMTFLEKSIHDKVPDAAANTDRVMDCVAINAN